MVYPYTMCMEGPAVRRRQVLQRLTDLLLRRRDAGSTPVPVRLPVSSAPAAFAAVAVAVAAVVVAAAAVCTAGALVGEHGPELGWSIRVFRSRIHST